MDGTVAWTTRYPGEDQHRLRASGRINSPATEDQEDFYTDGARSSSSSEEQRTNHLRGQRGSRQHLHTRWCARRSSSSSEGWRRGLLHPQIPGGSISCYLEFSSLQSRVVSVWGWLSLGVFEYRKFSPGGLQVRVGGCGRMRFGRSSAEDQQQDQPHRWKKIKKDLRLQRISSRINHIIDRGSRRASTSSGGEREVDHFGTRNNRTSSTGRSRSYIFSLLNVYGNQKHPEGGS